MLLLAAMLAATPAVAAPAPAAHILGTGIRVSDLERSIRFYTQILGMTVAGKLPHGTLTEVMLTFGGQVRGAGIILLKDSDPAKSPPLMLGNGFDKIVLDMPDIAAVVARLKGAGITTQDVHESTGVKILFVTDPDGYRYELIERSAPTAPKG